MSAETIGVSFSRGGGTIDDYQDVPQHFRPSRRGLTRHRPKHLKPGPTPERGSAVSRIKDALRPSLIEDTSPRHLKDKVGTYVKPGRTVFEFSRNAHRNAEHRVAKAVGAAALMIGAFVAGSVPLEQKAQADSGPAPEKIELTKCLQRPENFGPEMRVNISPSDQAQLQAFEKDYREAVDFVSETEGVDDDIRQLGASELLCVDAEGVIINPLIEIQLGENLQAPGASRAATLETTTSPQQKDWFIDIDQPRTSGELPVAA